MRFLLPVLLVLALPATAAAQAIAPATGAATAVSTDSATLNATVDSGSMFRFEYGTSSDYGLQTSDAQAGTDVGPQDVSESLGGLSEDTTYHYRVLAWPSGDPSQTAYGRDRTFHTLALPGATTGPIQDLRSDGTTLTGRVDPNRSATTWYFEWGRTKDYGQQTPETSAGRGSTSVPVSYVLNGLQPNATYHFRTVAINAAGIRRGTDRAFRTRRGPAGITVGPLIRHVRFGRATTIRGVVSGAGLSGLRVALQMQPFPFSAPFARIGDSVGVRKDGSFELVSRPLQISARLRVVTRSTPPVLSPEVTAFAKLLVGAGKQRMSRHRYRIQGSVTPHVKGAKVSIQRRKGKRWVFVHRTRTSAIGHGRIGYRFVLRQTRDARKYRTIVSPRNAAYSHGTSRTITVPALRPHRRVRH